MVVIRVTFSLLINICKGEQPKLHPGVLQIPDLLLIKKRGGYVL